MKLIKLSNLLMLGLALTFAVGCKTKPKGPTPLGGPGGTGRNIVTPLEDGSKLGGEQKPVTGEAGFGGGETASFNPDDMNQDRSAFAADTIYFDYDSSSIRSADQSKIAAVAAALQSDSSAKLLVEGHCDERGTEEYNRSLGERRALGAREALAAAGVSASRIATRSFGEDRPADPAHNESAWGANRRDDFVLLRPR